MNSPEQVLQQLVSEGQSDSGDGGKLRQKLNEAGYEVVSLADMADWKRRSFTRTAPPSAPPPPPDTGEHQQ